MREVESGSGVRWNKLSLTVMAAGAMALVAAGVLFALQITGTVGEPGYSGPGTITGFGSLDPTTPATDSAAAPTEVLPTPSRAPIERILLPGIGVDAPITIKGVDPNGVMENPDGPWDVSWYDFTARPGSGSNAVFSGHVDYYDVGPAVFWRLRELAQNDLVQVQLSDGTAYEYQVVAMENVDAATADIQSIVGDTESEVVTLITCAGTFDPAVGQYDQRLIVRAERVTGHLAPPNLVAP